MSEPSPAARRAAENLKRQFAIFCIPSHYSEYEPDSPDVEDLADVIERETGIGEACEIIRRLAKWQESSDSELSLHCGELTAQEKRSVRAAINAIAGNQARAFLEQHSSK